ncbi:MAG: leucyl aminopeptidase [Parachlamydiales bacterium]|nr:leucyl aminopeptidase [Parachlamydiales bacterium]
MKISFSKNFESSDVWVLPFWEGPKEAADLPVPMTGVLDDFKGKNGETAFYYTAGQRFLLVGLGRQDKACVEALRKAYAAVVRAAVSKKLKKIEILFPKCKQKEEFLRGIAEGIFLTNYSFTYKHDTIKEDPPVLLEKVGFVGVEKLKLIDEVETVVNGVHFVRDLVNGNSDDKLETILKAAKKLHPKVKTTVFDKKRIEKEGMGLLLAVNRGSEVEPAFVQASYTGNPKSKGRVVLVGKGILYDTGGLSLKPTDNMLTMKCDMAGAATVLGVVKVAAELGLNVNVTAVMPLTENCIDGKSYKLGDVYRSYAKKTVEITNTDAEGRLVLADALAYSVKNLKPDTIIDLATLTGACVVALGDDISGLFSNNDDLAEELMQASEMSDELIWRMPVHSDYFENYKSEIADMVNSGSREGGAIKAALFLKEYVGEIPWAHLDIAGPAYIPKPKHYNPMKGTGHGLRLLIEFLKNRA